MNTKLGLAVVSGAFALLAACTVAQAQQTLSKPPPPKPLEVYGNKFGGTLPGLCGWEKCFGLIQEHCRKSHREYKVTHVSFFRNDASMIVFECLADRD